MMKTKGIAIRLDDDLFNRIEDHHLPRSDLIRTAVKQYLNDSIEPQSRVPSNEVSDELYQDIYNTLYNREVQPLKDELQYQHRIITLLEQQLQELHKDKKFLQEQLHAQTLLTASKNPWLSNLKTRFLKPDNK